MLNATPRTFIGTTTFTVAGMTCGHCERAVVGAIASIDGVDAVVVDPASGSVTVTAATPIDRSDIAAAIDRAGHTLVS